jgi:hypothetical protein
LAVDGRGLIGVRRQVLDLAIEIPEASVQVGGEGNPGGIWEEQYARQWTNPKERDGGGEQQREKKDDLHEGEAWEMESKEQQRPSRVEHQLTAP